MNTFPESKSTIFIVISLVRRIEAEKTKDYRTKSYNIVYMTYLQGEIGLYGSMKNVIISSKMSTRFKFKLDQIENYYN